MAPDDLDDNDALPASPEDASSGGGGTRTPPAEADAGPAGISNEAVKARTGRTWGEWFAVLDEADAVKLGHKGIVAVLAGHRRVGHWWRQMIAVTYEQERGLREKHQTLQGYQTSTSRTIAVTPEKAFVAWTDDAVRSRWLNAQQLAIRKSRPSRSLRFSWGKNGSTVDVSFNARGSNKTQVVVDHRRLANADEVREMKTFWADALERLKESVET
jgi:uncharacterized protein YndB with AHSA1/START domain